jgi:hypothetical protein
MDSTDTENLSGAGVLSANAVDIGTTVSDTAVSDCRLGPLRHALPGIGPRSCDVSAATARLIRDSVSATPASGNECSVGAPL